MKTIKFRIEINAPKEKVWEILWSDEGYRQWTSVFSPSSQAISDWQEGSRVQFVDDKGSGMYSIIDKKIENTEIVFKHLGEMSKGEEKPQSDWAGSKERYVLISNRNLTQLNVELDTTADFEEYMNDKFPKALAIVKQLSEQ